jgi:hypothetical protein
MLIEPASYHKFFIPPNLIPDNPPLTQNINYYWDVEHYANMSLSDRCTAFYPLWPLIIRTFFHPETIQESSRYLVLTATTLFFISIFPTYWLFTKILKRKYLAFILVLTYCLNPMAIFRVIGYTETLFSILSLGLIWACWEENKIHQNIKIILISILSFLMALTRPVLIQLLFSSAASLVAIVIFECVQVQNYAWSSLFIQSKKYIYEMKITLAVWLSAILGYSCYGIFCWQSRGDFFAPFHDQKYWGKALGIHPELLLMPKSLLFDLLGLYLPVILLFVSLVFIYVKIRNLRTYLFIPKSNWWNISILYPPLMILVYIFNFLKIKISKNKNKLKLEQLKLSNYTKTLSHNYLFWFCLYFPVIHSIIIFFTEWRLRSLARFIFALPFFFLAVGYLCRCLPSQKIYRHLYWMIGISAIALVEQWIRYGRHEWMG